tara:strand:+ start:786 stop:2597 length:1812 start_codon:yes stop_codon:yes gene_type:complete
MAITDIEIEDTLETGAPSIKYKDDDMTPANPTLLAGPDSYQRILETVMAEMEAQLGRELTDSEYNEAGKIAYDIFTGGYAEGGPVDYSKDANYKGWKKTYETNKDAASMNENHSKYLKFYNRENKAYGGIMGLDGRRQYGIGSWFQEKIMDPIKKNPLVSAAAAALAVDQFGIKGTDIGGNRRTQDFLGNILGKFKSKPAANETFKRVIGIDEKDGSKIYETVNRTPNDKESFLTQLAKNKTIQEGIARSIIPIAGGLTAGLFADKIDKPEEIGLDRGTGVGIQNVRKVANLLGQEEGMAAGLNFLPDVATRKFSPAEMAVAYGNAETQPIQQLAEGGRTGYAKGDRVTAQELVRRMQEINVDMLQAEGNELVQLMRESLSIRDRLKKLKRKGVDVEEVEDEIKMSSGASFDEQPKARSFIEGVEESAGLPIISQPKEPSPQDTYIASVQDKVLGTSKPMMAKSIFKPEMMKASMRKPEVPMEIREKLMEIIKPSGSMEEIFEGMERRPRAEGGLMNLGGMEKDYREDGGFVPIGREEKADDVPARLSVNEFVFTADAVRGAGDGDVDEGAKRLQGIMKELEKRGQQGQDMIDVSERISEVMA